MKNCALARSERKKSRHQRSLRKLSGRTNPSEKSFVVPVRSSFFCRKSKRLFEVFDVSHSGDPLIYSNERGRPNLMELPGSFVYSYPQLTIEAGYFFLPFFWEDLSIPRVILHLKGDLSAPDTHECWIGPFPHFVIAIQPIFFSLGVDF